MLVGGKEKYFPVGEKNANGRKALLVGGKISCGLRIILWQPKSKLSGRSPII